MCPSFHVIWIAHKNRDPPEKKTEGTIKHRDPLIHVHVFFLYNNKMYMKKEGDQELQRIQFSSVIFSSDRYKKKKFV